jgi:hypothetical protein
LLQELVAAQDTLAVVATDHYAEAADHVVA